MLHQDVSSKFLRSAKLGFVFLRFSIVGMLSFTIDVGIFFILFSMTHDLFSSMVIARMLSAIFNFLQNKYSVYRSLSRARLQYEALRYSVLASVTILVAYGFLQLLRPHIAVSIIYLRIGIESILFFINFVVQRYVFRSTTEKAPFATQHAEALHL